MFQVHPGRLAALAVKELSVEKLVRGHFLTAGAHVVVEKVLSVLLLALLADDGEGLLNLVGPALAFAEALGILKLVELHVLQAGGTKRVTSAGVLHDLVGPVGTAVDGQAPVFGAGVIHLVGALGLLKETNLAALVLLGDVVHIALPALHGALRLRRDRIGRGHDVLSETRGSCYMNKRSFPIPHTIRCKTKIHLNAFQRKTILRIGQPQIIHVTIITNHEES
mmetsp:Transcript_16941/g.33066  ORF Transcript_16941/g.33066 Transcript_16941/m.33066 type:complete len:223 (+) Transcript_16941:380-1048(+)